jgi:hypothetical protein
VGQEKSELFIAGNNNGRERGHFLPAGWPVVDLFTCLSTPKKLAVIFYWSDRTSFFGLCFFCPSKISARTCWQADFGGKTSEHECWLVKYR